MKYLITEIFLDKPIHEPVENYVLTDRGYERTTSSIGHADINVAHKIANQWNETNYRGKPFCEGPQYYTVDESP